MKKIIIATAVSLSLLSAAAFAGSWGGSVFDRKVNVGCSDNFAVAAGTSNTSPAGGVCTSGQVNYWYAETGPQTVRFGVCRSQLTVYKQTCL